MVTDPSQQTTQLQRDFRVKVKRATHVKSNHLAVTESVSSAKRCLPDEAQAALHKCFKSNTNPLTQWFAKKLLKSEDTCKKMKMREEAEKQRKQKYQYERGNLNREAYNDWMSRKNQEHKIKLEERRKHMSSSSSSGKRFREAQQNEALKSWLDEKNRGVKEKGYNQKKAQNSYNDEVLKIRKAYRNLWKEKYLILYFKS